MTAVKKYFFMKYHCQTNDYNGFCFRTGKMPRLKATCLRNNLLTTLTVVGVLGGVFMGIILRQIETEDNKWTQRDMMYLQFPGEIFLQMLKALIIPLLVSSVVTAVGSLDLSLSKKIAFRAIFYYSITTLLAVTLGIILVLTIRPGGEAGKKYQDIKLKKIEVRKVLTADTILDLIRWAIFCFCFFFFVSRPRDARARVSDAIGQGIGRLFGNNCEFISDARCTILISPSTNHPAGSTRPEILWHEIICNYIEISCRNKLCPANALSSLQTSESANNRRSYLLLLQTEKQKRPTLVFACFSHAHAN